MTLSITGMTFATCVLQVSAVLKSEDVSLDLTSNHEEGTETHGSMLAPLHSTANLPVGGVRPCSRTGYA